METYAIHKTASLKPRQARLTMDLIRGKDVKTAQAILKNTNTKASPMILKVLNSAIANAVNNFNAKETELVISECLINPGPIRKKIRFGSRSNVDRSDHRTSHIIIKVSDGKNDVKEAK
jgi:large subunit ribosomal protein L22